MDSPQQVGKIFAQNAVEAVDSLVDLLFSFGLSDEVVNGFVDNGYTLDTLKIIERKEIEDLIQPPNLAERTKCIFQFQRLEGKAGIPTGVFETGDGQFRDHIAIESRRLGRC